MLKLLVFLLLVDYSNSQTTTPRPTTPPPTTPQPTSPQTTTPQPTTPRPTTPQPTSPQTTTPEPTSPQSTATPPIQNCLPGPVCNYNDYAIPAYSRAYSTIYIPKPYNTIDDVVLSDIEISFDGYHEYPEELKFYMNWPNEDVPKGTLTSGSGTDPTTFSYTISSNNMIQVNPFADVLGTNPFGNWTFEIYDVYPFDYTGTLDSWCITQLCWTNNTETITPEPTTPQTTTPEPTTERPTTAEPTTAEPTTAEPTIPAIRNTCIAAPKCNYDDYVIPDPGSVYSHISIPNTYGVNNVMVTDIEISFEGFHTYPDDIAFFLDSPNGDNELLHNGVGNSATTFSYIFNSDTTLPTYGFDNVIGTNPFGNWTLEVNDNLAVFSGTLDFWCITQLCWINNNTEPANECNTSSSQHTVDWDDELSGISGITTDLSSQQVSASNELFRLQITATADYVLRANYDSLGYTQFGVTYVLDSFQFEDSGRLLQDANYCENRFSSDFSGSSQISSFWTYDTTPNDGIGFPGSNGIGLEYPNSLYNLTLVDAANPCDSGVEWTRIFNYNQLKNNCNFTFVTDDNYINLTGYFYLTLVSPNPLTYGDGTSNTDPGQYITKQLQSQEITISFPRAYNLIVSGSVDLVGSFIISSDFNRDNNIFEVTILTYVPSYLQIVSIDDIISANNDWSVSEDLASYDPSSCLVQDDYRCWQKFIVSRSISSCSNENVQILDSDIELLGSFSCSLTSDTTNPSSSCYEFINNINDNQQTNDVSLDSILFSYTEGCDDELYNVEFSGLLTFWNSDFSVEDTIKEYESNGQTIYMQAEILDLDSYNVFGVEIESILLCTADVSDINLFTSCLDSGIVDNSLFYNLLSDPDYQITNILDNSPDTTDNYEQFSFTMPPIADDVFFVDVTVKLTLNTGTRRLRGLLQSDTFNRFTSAFVGANIIQQVTDPNSSNNSNNNNNKNNLIWIVISLSLVLFLCILGCAYLIFRHRKLSNEIKKANNMNDILKIKSVSQSNRNTPTPTHTGTSTPTVGSTNTKQEFAITTFEPMNI